MTVRRGFSGRVAFASVLRTFLANTDSWYPPMMNTSSSRIHNQSLPLALAIAFLGCLLLGTGSAEAQSLRGSRASMDLQNRQARAHDFTYLSSPGHVQRFIDAGLLVHVPDGPDHIVNNVSFPYTRPEVKLFIERLSAQFRAACGEKLVVTSLTRPQSHQPSNASSRSVHPTGMALDLRRHYDTASCGRWLERVLLSLEKTGVLEATEEHYPPHFHVALFPTEYATYVDRLTGGSVAVAASSTTVDSLVPYEVRRQDTLWRIARRHGTTPEEIQRANGLASTTIYPGQLLQVPGGQGR